MDRPDSGVAHAVDEHHLRRVLRVRHDQTVTVSDGAGHWMPAHLLAGGLERAGERAGEPPLPPARGAVAIPKGERVDLVVQKLTELGVTEIILAATDRGVVRWDAERAGRQTQRLTTIARAAASQSRDACMAESARSCQRTRVVTDDHPHSMDRLGYSELSGPDSTDTVLIFRCEEGPRSRVAYPPSGLTRFRGGSWMDWHALVARRIAASPA